MPRRTVSTLAAALTLAICSSAPRPSAAAAPADAQQSPLNETYLEISALSKLYDLGATPDQLKSLQSLSADTVSKNPLPPSPEVAAPYRSALTALRDAYVQNNDNEIGDSDERVSNLEEKMDNPPDPHVDLTDAARHKAKDAAKLFTPTQFADYIAVRANDAPDPAATLIDALGTVPGQPDKDFAQTRARTADDLSSLLAGPDSPDRKALADRIGSLLDRAHALTPDAYKSQKADLDKEAHKLADPADPPATLANWLQLDLADLLSNPELPAALAARQK